MQAATTVNNVISRFLGRNKTKESVISLGKGKGGKNDKIKAEDVLNSFPLPSKEERLEEKILDHMRQEGPFKYVTIAGFSKLTKGERLDRLVSSRPIVPSESIDLTDIPVIHLVDWNNKLKLSDVIDKKTMNSMESFIRLSEVRISFSPASGFFEDYSTLTLGLEDGRLMTNNLIRSVKAHTNVSILATMSMDCFIHKKDASRVFLTINCANNALLPGTVWGTIQVIIELEHSNVCKPAPLENTQIIIELPESTMKKVTTNPRHVNATFDPEDLGNIRSLHKKGRIIDRSIPANRQRAINFTRSEAGSLDDREDDFADGPRGKSKGIEGWSSGVRPEFGAGPSKDDDGSSKYSETESEKARALETAQNSAANAERAQEHNHETVSIASTEEAARAREGKNVAFGSAQSIPKVPQFNPVYGKRFDN